jgi:hypothetical protein
MSIWHRIALGGSSLKREGDPDPAWFRAILLAWAMIVAGLLAGSVAYSLQ